MRGCKFQCKCKFNVKHRECLRNHLSQRLKIKCLTIPDRIGIWKCWFLRRGEKWSTRRKTSRSKEENQQQTQPTYMYDTGSGNRTRDTLVGGKCSHHCRWGICMAELLNGMYEAKLEISQGGGGVGRYKPSNHPWWRNGYFLKPHNHSMWQGKLFCHLI